MQFIHKYIIFATAIINFFLLIACAPESKYNGGSGALQSYESMDAYSNTHIKYRTDYTKPTQSSFSSTLVANDRDNIRQTPQNMRQNTQTTQNNTATKQMPYESPVQGNGSFTPTQSLLGGMRDSEAIQRATMRPYTVRGKTYRPHPVKVGDTFDGVASWYGPDFHAKATSNGETYNMYAHTAAHKTLPMNTIVKVYNKDNGKTTIVRINDRGPFVTGRIIDLSNIAAHDIAMVGKGVANVRIEVVGFGGNLQGNTPSKDSKATTKNITQQNTPSRTQGENKDTQQYAVLKPRQNTQPQAIKTIPQQTEQPKHTAQNTNTMLQDSKQMTTESAPMQQRMLGDNATQEIKESIPKQKESENAMTNNADSLPFAVSEEELPIFETNTPKTEDKHRVVATKEKTQINNETLESSATNIVPKRIDNTETLKNLDTAMQKFKDTTDDITKKAKQDNEWGINNEIKAPQIPNKQHELQKDGVAQQNQVTKATDNAPQQNVANFMISLNVFSQEERAKHFQDESSKIIKNTPYTIGIVPTDKGLYRVALRGFKTYEEAKSFIQQHNITGHVVPENK